MEILIFYEKRTAYSTFGPLFNLEHSTKTSGECRKDVL